MRASGSCSPLWTAKRCQNSSPFLNLSNASHERVMPTLARVGSALMMRNASSSARSLKALAGARRSCTSSSAPTEPRLPDLARARPDEHRVALRVREDAALDDPHAEQPAHRLDDGRQDEAERDLDSHPQVEVRRPGEEGVDAAGASGGNRPELSAAQRVGREKKDHVRLEILREGPEGVDQVIEHRPGRWPPAAPPPGTSPVLRLDHRGLEGLEQCLAAIGDLEEHDGRDQQEGELQQPLRERAQAEQTAGRAAERRGAAGRARRAGSTTPIPRRDCWLASAS